MSVDFAALTQAVVAGVADVRACLVVSRDGLSLGSFPPAEEERTLAAWSKLTMLGEIDRGFVTIREEMWVFARRGAYSAVATASSSARPGVILDQLDQLLLSAEEARVRKDVFRAPAERETPALETPRGMRTSLHPESREVATPTPAPAPTAPAREAPSAAKKEATRPADPAEGEPDLAETTADQPDVAAWSVMEPEKEDEEP